MGSGALIRPARAADLAAAADIYAFYVLNGLASFELEPPSVEEMARRHASITAATLPYLVAELDGRVAGYAYASAYRTRPAYRYTVEDSVYVHRDCGKRGVGGALLRELIARCAAAGARQMIAVIGDSANHPSIRLHEKHGFARVGLLPSVGYKFERWVDSVLMQRALGAGDTTAPAQSAARG
jgi:L-amino acid N-acyltransferase YncA